MHSKDYFRVHFLILPLPTVSQVRLSASGDWLAYVREGTNINLHNIYNGDTVPTFVQHWDQPCIGPPPELVRWNHGEIEEDSTNLAHGGKRWTMLSAADF